MSESPSPELLKANPNRAVILETAPDGTVRVVKRYRARGWLRRLGDRGRARGEYEVLRALGERGIAVPEALSLRRRGGAWEVVCRAIPGASTLAESIADPGALGGRNDVALADALGRLLGRAHAAGLDHADLHAGNVLLDGDRRPWLIDFTHARLRARGLDAPKLERDVTNLAADARERVPLPLRRRFLVRWWRALSDRERRALPSLRELAGRIEGGARARRRVGVRAHRASWYRGFDFLRALAPGEVRGLVRREVPVADEAALVAAITSAGPPPALIPHPLDSGRELLVIETSGEAASAWGELGRASEHALPCAEPLALLDSPRKRAVFSLPAGSKRWSASAPVDALTTLREALHDRGFGAVLPEACWVGPRGAALLGPGVTLEEPARSTDG